MFLTSPGGVPSRRAMERVPDGISSVAAATVSQTVSAMLKSATAAAAAAGSAIPRTTTDEIPSLDAGPIPANGVPPTRPTNLGSGRTTEAIASEENVHQFLTPEQESPISATATTTVPPFSPPGPAVEDTMSGVELSGRRGSGGEEGHETDAERAEKDGARTDSADASRRSQRELEPVVLPDGGRGLFDATTVDGGGEEQRGERDERNESRGGDEGAEEEGEGDESDGGEEQEEKKNENCNGRVVHYARPEDGATVLISGRREGAVVQVCPFSSGTDQAVLRKEAGSSPMEIRPFPGPIHLSLLMMRSTNGREIASFKR